MSYQQLTVLDISAGVLQATQLLTSTREMHVTPFGTAQKFIYCY